MSKKVVPDPTLSVLGSFVNGPATCPHGAGSALINICSTERHNLATALVLRARRSQASLQ